MPTRLLSGTPNLLDQESVVESEGDSELNPWDVAVYARTAGTIKLSRNAVANREHLLVASGGAITVDGNGHVVLGPAVVALGSAIRYGFSEDQKAWVAEVGAAGVGPSGPSGPSGASGASGASGSPGPSGPSGASGADGASGPPGPSGASGVDGASGPPGPSGASGADGASGPPGPSGASGADGASGPPGPSGPSGASGADGASGPAGPSGPSGASGASGPAGPIGGANGDVLKNNAGVVAGISPVSGAFLGYSSGWAAVNAAEFITLLGSVGSPASSGAIRVPFLNSAQSIVVGRPTAGTSSMILGTDQGNWATMGTTSWDRTTITANTHVALFTQRDILFYTTGTARAGVLQIGGNGTGLCVGNSSDSPTFGGGSGVINLQNATTNPGSNPTTSVLLYADTGAAKCRGSGGTITTFGPADPHCPRCGSDAGWEWENETIDEYTHVCARCLVEAMTALQDALTKVLGSPLGIHPREFTVVSRREKHERTKDRYR